MVQRPRSSRGSSSTSGSSSHFPISQLLFNSKVSSLQRELSQRLKMVLVVMTTIQVGLESTFVITNTLAEEKLCTRYLALGRGGRGWSDSRQHLGILLDCRSWTVRRACRSIAGNYSVEKMMEHCFLLGGVEGEVASWLQDTL